MQPALFFDRDGVLNVDVNYAYQPEQITWVEGALETVAAAKKAGYLTFVVTNQAGVARGLYSENDVRTLHIWMQGEFNKAGGTIDAFAYCPHHPEFSGTCLCRKPKPGMLLDLMNRFAVDKTRSFLVGDKESDVEAAFAAGIKGTLFMGGHLLAHIRDFLRQNSELGGKI